jgi:hypothetical protein
MKVFHNNIDITNIVLSRITLDGCFQMRYSDPYRSLTIELDDGSKYSIGSNTILVWDHEGIYVELANGLCDLLIDYTPTCKYDDKIVFLWNNEYRNVTFKDIFKGKHQSYIETKLGPKPEYILGLSDGTFKKADRRYNKSTVFTEFAPI